MLTKRNFGIFIILLIIYPVLIESCHKDEVLSDYFNPDISYGSMTDQDGNTYKTVRIGDQVWMAEDLRAVHY